MSEVLFFFINLTRFFLTAHWTDYVLDLLILSIICQSWADGQALRLNTVHNKYFLLVTKESVKKACMND